MLEVCVCGGEEGEVEGGSRGHENMGLPGDRDPSEVTTHKVNAYESVNRQPVLDRAHWLKIRQPYSGPLNRNSVQELRCCCGEQYPSSSIPFICPIYWTL